MSQHPDKSLYFYQLWTNSPPPGMVLNPNRAKARTRLREGFFKYAMLCFGPSLGGLGAMFGAVQGGGPVDVLLWGGVFLAPLVIVSFYLGLRSPPICGRPRYIPAPEPTPAPAIEAEITPEPKPDPAPKLPAVIPTRAIEMLATSSVSPALRSALSALLPQIAIWARRRDEVTLIVQRTRGDHLIELVEQRCHEMQFAEHVAHSEDAARKLTQTVRSTTALLQVIMQKLDDAEISAYGAKLAAQDRQISGSLATMQGLPSSSP